MGSKNIVIGLPLYTSIARYSEVSMVSSASDDSKLNIALIEETAGQSSHFRVLHE